MRAEQILAALIAVALLTACTRSPDTGTPKTTPDYVFDPDVPKWRGGCFYEGAPGKVINGFPSQDVRLFGTPCGGPAGEPAGPGGLVYLDNFDPFTGTGNVTILSAKAGSRPMVIAPRGGTGGIIPGSTGVRLNAEENALLTLSEVGDVTGNLLLVSLPDGALQSIGTYVRVENYEFLSSNAILFVGNYATASGPVTSSKGDLLVWEGGTTRTVSRNVSRFDFIMYRLDEEKKRVAYLKDYTEQGGTLYVRACDGLSEEQHVDDAVSGMTFADDGTLVYSTYNTDGTPQALRLFRPGALAPEDPIAQEVTAFDGFGNTIVYATGWNVLTRTASLWRTTTTAGDTPTPISSSSPLLCEVIKPESGPTRLAYANNYKPDSGMADLFTVSLADGVVTAIDTDITPAGGLSLSPADGFLAYTKGFDRPVTPSNPSSQPGIAAELWVARTNGPPTPFLAASLAATERVAWSPSELAVAALANFDRASNTGHLVLMSPSGGAIWYEAERVAPSGFDLGAPGYEADAHVAVLRDWNDALQIGELVMAPVAANAAGRERVIDVNVPFFLTPRGNRVIYAVHGDGRDGLWLGAGQ